MQLDSINWADATATIPEFNYVEFRRLRLMLDGVGYGVYDFRVQMEFEPESSDAGNVPVTEVKDAYFSMNELPGPFRRARIGHFFVPFSLEQVTNDVQGIFLERSIPTAGIFTGDREVGFAFYGVSDDLNTTWTTGFFADGLNEAIKERNDDNQGQRLSGRVTHLPYYDEPSNGRYLVHTGCGVLATHDQDNIVRFRARPQIHEGPFLIDTGNMAADNFVIGNVELATVWGPLMMQSEAFYTNVDLDVGGVTPSWGMYVYGSYFLTGENRIYERFGQHGAQFGRVPTLLELLLRAGRLRAGCLGSEGTLVEPDAHRIRRRPVQRLHVRLQLVLEPEHPRDVRLDPSVHQQRHGVRRNAVRHHRHAIRLQYLTQGSARTMNRLIARFALATLLLGMVATVASADDGGCCANAAAVAPVRKSAVSSKKKRKWKSSAGARSAKTSAFPARANAAARTARWSARPAARMAPKAFVPSPRSSSGTTGSPAAARRSTPGTN